MEAFIFLGSLLYRDLLDNHDADARIKKAPQASTPGAAKSSALPASPSDSQGNLTRAACSRSHTRLRVVVPHAGFR